MIYLVTGTPGTGKTAFVMDSVLKNRFGLFKDENGNFRPMFSVNLEVIDKAQLPISPVRPEDFIHLLSVIVIVYLQYLLGAWLIHYIQTCLMEAITSQPSI